jgi:hypothetical protein
MSEEILIVESPDDWRAIDERLGGMEDASIRRFRFEGADEMNPAERSLAFGPPEARELVIEVQAQFREFERAELRFTGVREFRYRNEWNAVMEWRSEQNGWRVEFLSLEVTADRCTVTVH